MTLQESLSIYLGLPVVQDRPDRLVANSPNGKPLFSFSIDRGRLCAMSDQLLMEELYWEVNNHESDLS